MSSAKIPNYHKSYLATVTSAPDPRGGRLLAFVVGASAVGSKSNTVTLSQLRHVVGLAFLRHDSMAKVVEDADECASYAGTMRAMMQEREQVTDVPVRKAGLREFRADASRSLRLPSGPGAQV